MLIFLLFRRLIFRSFYILMLIIFVQEDLLFFISSFLNCPNIILISMISIVE